MFKNVRMTRDHLGPFMRRFAEDHDIMATLRRMLVGSYRGDKTLLATTVLRCCASIRSSSTLRTRASVGSVKRCPRPDETETPTHTRPLSRNTIKLLGNSGYRKAITNVDRLRDVKYCKEAAASTMINHRRFRQLHLVVDNAYEIEMNKRTVTYALPVGFFVLQYAKMRRLFQYCEMDTDSANLAMTT